jgi:hypothetical protein
MAITFNGTPNKDLLPPKEDHQDELPGFTLILFSFGPPSSTPRAAAPATEDPEKGWVCHCGAYEKGDGAQLSVTTSSRGDTTSIDMKCGKCNCEYGFDKPREGVIEGYAVGPVKQLGDGT